MLFCTSSIVDVFDSTSDIFVGEFKTGSSSPGNAVISGWVIIVVPFSSFNPSNLIGSNVLDSSIIALYEDKLKDETFKLLICWLEVK